MPSPSPPECACHKLLQPDIVSKLENLIQVAEETRLLAECSRHRDTKRAYESKLKEADEAFHNLNDKYEAALVFARQELEKTKKELWGRINSLEGSLADVQDAKTGVDDELKKMTDSYLLLQTDKANSEVEKKELVAEKNKLEAEKKVLVSGKSTLEAEKRDLEAEKSKLEAEKRELEAEKSKLEAEKKVLVSGKSTLETEKSKLEKAISKEKSEVVRLQKSLEDFQKQQKARDDQLKKARINELLPGQGRFLDNYPTTKSQTEKKTVLDVNGHILTKSGDILCPPSRQAKH